VTAVDSSPRALADLAWHIDVRRVGDSFLYGEGYCGDAR
jgi:hypothetical protein